MTDDAALFAAALAQPDADTPRLVLADWFDDHGEDELAWALRTVPGIIPFLHDLTRWDRLPATPTQERKDGRLVNRFESQYWAELLVRYRDQFPMPPEAPTEYDPDAGWVEPGGPERLPGAGEFLAEWRRLRRSQIEALRDEAAHTAAGWPRKEVTFPAGDDLRAVETRALLLHELAIRGHSPRSVVGWTDLWVDLDRRGHPLFRLPPELLPVEQGIDEYLPLDGSAGGRTYPHRPAPSPLSAVGEARPIVVGSETSPGDRAQAAVRAWELSRFGATIEACAFALGNRFTSADEWAGWFQALPLPSVIARRRAMVAEVHTLSPAEVFVSCFWAAQRGGAYRPPAGSAYARLHAWESFGWLAGADPDANCEAVAALADQCRWFGMTGGWPEYTLAELGVVAVRPDGMSVAVLAAAEID